MSSPNRPGPPYAAPRGRRWVPGYADDIQLTGDEPYGHGSDHKCQRQSGNPYKFSPCNAATVARVEGEQLCGYHLGLLGYWVDAGVPMRWELEPTGEEIE